MTTTNILDHFSTLCDPRQSWKVLYPLPEILLVVLCGVMAGADDFVEIERWGRRKLNYLRRLLPFKDGICSHDTLNDVMNVLPGELFAECFTNWVSKLRDQDPEIVAIDGKTSRRAHAHNGRRLHLVSAWASRQRLVLGQEPCDEKENEISAIPRLLERLELAGSLVTIDAMGCQHNIASAILAKGADYLLALKGNQKSLHSEVALFFDAAKGLDSHTTTDADHGRIEIRRASVCHAVDWLSADRTAPRELFCEDGRLHWAAEYSTWGSQRRLFQAENDNHPTRGPLQGYDDHGTPVYASKTPINGNLALKPVSNPDPYLCPIRFQGQWADEETGLYYNRFRYYDSLSSQYMSPDPIGLSGGTRTSGYCESPSFQIDPLGLQNLNTNNATGNFGLYKIYANDKIFKVGLADMNRITKSSGLPTRLHQQLRKLRQCYGADKVSHSIRKLGKIKKKCAKIKENKAIAAETLKNKGRVPPGNSLSFGDGSATGADPCLDGSFPKGSFH